MGDGTSQGEPEHGETHGVSRIGRALSHVVDYPIPCLVLIVALSVLSWGGFADPEWAKDLYHGVAGSPAVDSGNEIEEDDPFRDEDDDRPRRRRGGGGGLGDADTILVVQSKQFFTYEGAQAMRAIVDRLGSLNTVLSATWMDNAPPLNIFGLPEPVVPRGKASPQRFAVAREKAIKHPLVVGQYLSKDAETAIVMIRFNWVFVQDESECTTQIVDIARQVLSEHPGVEMQVSATGPVPLRLMLMANRVDNEFKFQMIGYAIILTMAAILFRGFLVVLVVAASPILAVLWTLGFIRYFGWEDNPFSPVIVPVLISLVGFMDSVHMIVFIRRRVYLGDKPVEACRTAIANVGLASFLTAFTTSIGMGSLSYSDHTVVREFGWACVIGVFVSWTSVMLAIPLLCRTPLGRRLAVGIETGFVEKNLNVFTSGVRTVLKYPRAASCFAIALMITCLSIASTLRPDDKTSNMMVPGSPAQLTLAHLDKSLGGLDMCRIKIDWQETNVTPEEVASLVSRVDHVLDSEPLIGHPLSICRLLAALPGDDVPENKMSMMEVLPPPLKKVLYDVEMRTASVVFRVQDLGTATYKPVFDRIEEALKSIESQSASFKIDMEGAPIWKWRNLYRIVVDLALSLGTDLPLIVLILAVTFRSLRIGLISILPNTLPLATAATWLVFSGRPLDMVSVCAFTICLGISVDDTVHFLTRYSEEQHGAGSRSDKIERAFCAVGTGLIMSSLVLVAGFLSVLTSESPEHRTFATLGAITLSTGLLGDLFLLPALLKWLDVDR